MQQLLGGLQREVAVVNLDPANDALRYSAAVDVTELVSLEAVQRELGLGPNGGTAEPHPSLSPSPPPVRPPQARLLPPPASPSAVHAPVALPLHAPWSLDGS